MPEMTKYAPGTPSWVDLGTSDPADASRFYSGLFGWTIVEGPPDAGGYRMCMLDDKPVAGMGPQMSADMSPCWTTYISVGNADDMAAAIKEDGGSIAVEPFEVMDVGRMAVATDPGGAVFSIWQPRIHHGAATVNEPNTWCWNELTTDDPQHSVEFYGAVFGWTATLVPMGDSDYTEFHLGDRRIAGMSTPKTTSTTEAVPNQWQVCFAVDDCEAAVKRVEELGGAVTVPPTEVPPGTFAVVRDPQGATFSIVALRRSGG